MSSKALSQWLTVALTLYASIFICSSVALTSEVEGFTEPYRDIDIASSEMGLLKSLDVKEGDRVKQGQIFARLDDAVPNATLAIAKSSMEARGRVELAEAEVALQTEILAKLNDLRERGHASRQEIERAKQQLRIAEARLLTVCEEQQVRTLEYARAQVQVEQLRLISPIDGIVTRICKDRGEFVSVSDPVVLKVVQLDPLLIVFSVPADRARELSVGQTVDLRVGEAPAIVNGAVEFVSPTADPQSGTTRVRVRVSNPDEKLPSGANCRLILSGEDDTSAKLDVGEHSRGLRLP